MIQGMNKNMEEEYDSRAEKQYEGKKAVILSSCVAFRLRFSTSAARYSLSLNMFLYLNVFFSENTL